MIMSLSDPMKKHLFVLFIGQPFMAAIHAFLIYIYPLIGKKVTVTFSPENATGAVTVFG